MKRKLPLDDKVQDAWAFQIVDAQGQKQLLVWMCFPSLYRRWAEDDDDNDRHPCPFIQLFRFRREARDAKKHCLFRDAKIVKVRIGIEAV